MKHISKITGFVAGFACCVLVASCGNNNANNGANATDTTAGSATTAATIPAATPVSDTANNRTNSGAAPMNNNGGNADANFVMDVAQSNAQEIQMLKAGIDKGTSAALKSDARKMLMDHNKLAKEMSDYAGKKNINLPAADTSESMAMNGAPGASWDQDWVTKMVDGHQQTINKFESAQNTVTDPELKSMITKTLPTLHQHLKMVQDLQSKVSK
jgi:putative membrane protein